MRDLTAAVNPPSLIYFSIICRAQEKPGLSASRITRAAPDGSCLNICRGRIPCEGAAGAYAASGFYASDRYASYVTDWKNDYENGSVIVSGRYTTSNAIYQMTKLPRDQWDSFLAWLKDYEYKRLGLPEPDLVLFLDMPIEISQKLLSARYNGDESKKDIHESSAAFLRRCRESALYTAKRWGWRIIQCSDGTAPLPIEDIALRIKKETEEI